MFMFTLQCGAVEEKLNFGGKVSQKEMSKFVTLPESFLGSGGGRIKGGLTTLVMEFRERNY